MSAKLLCFGAAFLALLGTLFGCGGQISSSPESRQGTAVWVKPGSPAPADAPIVRVSSNNDTSVNLQRAAVDLGLLPQRSKNTSTPISAQAPAPVQKIVIEGEAKSQRADMILEKIRRERLAQKPFNLTLIKSYIDAIIETDLKIDEKFSLSDRTILSLKNESAQMIRILKSMMATQGVARIPIFDEKGRLVEYRELSVGGDLIYDLVNHQYVDESGRACDKVLCVLASIFKPEIKATTAMPELATSPIDAAYLALYTAFQSRYIINLMVPRYPEDNAEPENYKKKTKRFGVFTSDQVSLIAKTIWMLPSHFEGLSSLLFISGDKKNDPSVRREIGHTTIRDDGNYVGTHIYKTAGIHGSSKRFKVMGIMILDLNKFGDYEINFSYILYEYTNGGRRETGERLYTQEEVRNFMPDMREQLEQNYIQILVHELVHAFDLSDKGRLLVGDAGESGYFMYLLNNISTHKSWLDLSGWKKIFSVNDQQHAERWIPNRDFITELSYSDEQKKAISNRAVFRGDMKWTPAAGAKFPKTYGMVNPIEDLAVVAEKYALDSALLKKFEEGDGAEKAIPAKYNFVANVLFTEVIDGRHYRYVYRRKKFIESAIAQRDFLKANVWLNCKDYDFKTQKWTTYKTGVMVIDGRSQVVQCDEVLKD